MTTAFINRIATAVPPHDVHNAFIAFATGLLPEGTSRNLFRRMARLSAIEHRYSFVQPVPTEDGRWKDVEQVYEPGDFPVTARRMKFFESPNLPTVHWISSHSASRNATRLLTWS
jgi:hypothetical protein